MSKNENICPAGGVCNNVNVCDTERLCTRLHARPVDILMSGAETPAVHFVGFRGDEYHSAVRVFGLPDFVHRVWDGRAMQEIAICDTVVFGPKCYNWKTPCEFSHDDSAQPDDPATIERSRS
jgi:hypothetical protein